VSAPAATLTLGGDLPVKRIGLGTLMIMNAGADRAKAVLSRAIELGVDFIDTADSYTAGQIELLIADTLHPYPEGLVIATKGGQVVVDGEPRPDCRPEHLRAACEASLARLRVERIDLYQLHSPDPEVPIAESIGALAELRDEGKIRHIGVSNIYDETFQEAAAVTALASVQNPYNLSHRRSEEMLDETERRGMAFLPYVPLGRGELTSADGALGEVASGHGATPAQVAIAWLMHRSAAMLPIPCTSSVDHLEDNVRAASLELSDEDLARLAT
jgi:aryl-alcohol dehydrogenase-like predicted oxidoreductase